MIRAGKGQIGTDFLCQNPCHKVNCANVCPFWDQTGPRKPLAYDLALSGIRPQAVESEKNININQHCILTQPLLHRFQASGRVQNAALCGLHAGQHEEAR